MKKLEMELKTLSVEMINKKIALLRLREIDELHLHKKLVLQLYYLVEAAVEIQKQIKEKA